MGDHPTAGGPNIFPFFRYDDPDGALEWLARAFGFEEKAVARGRDDAIVHAEMRFGPGVIAFGPSKDDPLGMGTPRALGGVNQGTYVYVQDLEAHYRRAVEAGAEIVRPFEETDYGSKEYTARDLEGNLWSFGTYDMSASSTNPRSS
jgi:uncharacterized glyoxalase superfamily protein PhnB